MTRISLGFHDVEEASSAAIAGTRTCPSLYTLSRQSFQNHLEAIVNAGASGRVQTVCGENAQGPSPVYLTFDDGALGAYTCIADELETLGWRGHFFVTSGWIGRAGFMNTAQIRELYRRGHLIGSHTHTHPERMSSLTPTELQQEWEVSCAILSDIVGDCIRVASVANGYYSRKVAASAWNAGIKFLFNSEPTSRMRLEGSCHVLGRYAIKATTSPVTTGAIAAGRRGPRLAQAVAWEMRKVAKAVGGKSYLKIRELLYSGNTGR